MNDLQPVAARARTRAGLARWFSFLALVAALGLVISFMVQLGVFNLSPKNQVVVVEAPVENPNQVTGGPSRIAGFDKNNLPFTITAQHGEQDAGVASLVHLNAISSEFTRPSGAKLAITSNTALYETRTKALDLEGEVLFAEGDRFRARMDKASVNMDDQTLTSRSPVSVDIIGGHITADSLAISSNGSRILFKGGVKARFVTQRQNSGDGQ